MVENSKNCDTAAILQTASQTTGETQISTDWSMFRKETELGEGAYGTVYKVKCLKTSVISADGSSRVSMEGINAGSLRRKLNMRAEGVNMSSSDGKKVRSLIMDQTYVIKVIDTSKMPKDGAMEALMEIELLAELDSHFIVGYLDSFIEDSKINIVMEYCQHHDLCSYVKKQNGKSFVENFIWKVFIHICLGVYYLHSRDIIHRDLKSLNIFLTKDNSAKVGDLGASRRIDEKGAIIDANVGAEKVGTPFYLAPELWLGKPCSKKTDIWALGVILYEICALQVPYQAETMEELEQRVLKEKYLPLPNGVNKIFTGIIQRCLQKKPELRPSIDEIIMMDDFQEKCKLIKITLPLELNKSKLIKQRLAKPQSEVPVLQIALTQSIRPQSTVGTLRLTKRKSLTQAIPLRHLSTQRSQPQLIPVKHNNSGKSTPTLTRPSTTRQINLTPAVKDKRSSLLINTETIPERVSKQLILPQSNKTSKLRAALIIDCNNSTAQKKDEPTYYAKTSRNSIKKPYQIVSQKSRLILQSQPVLPVVKTPAFTPTQKLLPVVSNGPRNLIKGKQIQSTRTVDSVATTELTNQEVPSRVKYTGAGKKPAQKQIGFIKVTKPQNAPESRIKKQMTELNDFTKNDGVKKVQGLLKAKTQQVRLDQIVKVRGFEEDQAIQMTTEEDMIFDQDRKTQLNTLWLAECRADLDAQRQETEEDILFDKLEPRSTPNEQTGIQDFRGDEQLLDGCQPGNLQRMLEDDQVIFDIN